MSGNSCIDDYDKNYNLTLAGTYDPISIVVSPRMMCQELVQEVNVLMEMNESTLNNAIRFSYLVSMITDVEAS